MRETSKSRNMWSSNAIEWTILKGDVIDIGASDDPVTPNAKIFDKNEGDANTISRYVKKQFNCVYASHCLEHMHKPKEAILEWWKLVKPGGYIFFTVPDEDLYEQGVFPSRFNPDHKATFTLAKAKSWSPVSINVFDLARSLPNGKIIKIELQDNGYDRKFMTFGPRHHLIFKAVDQTRKPDVLAQISCIVQKIS